jgi:hypothetical protein
MGKTQDRRYTPTAQALHWLIALLIVVQFVLARMAAQLPLGELWTTPEGLLQRSFRATLTLPGSTPQCPEPQ